MKSKTRFEYLNAEEIRSILSPNYQNMLILEIFNSIDSTNNYLLNKAKKGAASGMVCLAEAQTQGRGRHGRYWISREGNIYCSILWRFDQATFSGLSIAVAVMVMNTLHKLGIQQGIQLKWPNDILYQGQKLAGILLESPSPGVVVIGIGLNIKTPPVDVSIGVDRIIDREIKRNFLIGLLLQELCEGLSNYQREGLVYFRSQWDECDFLKDKEVVLLTQPENIHGVAQGINEKGELIIKNRENKIQAYSSGEISVRLDSYNEIDNAKNT